MFGAVDEVVNLCHGAREQNYHAIESRRRVLELEAREHAGPVNAAGHAHPAVEEEAVDTAGGGESGDEKDEGEEKGGGDSGWGRARPRFPDEPVVWNAEETRSERDENEEDLFGPDCLALVGPPDEIGWPINPRLNISPAGHAMLRQWELVVVDKRGKEVDEGEDDGGGKDLTSESDAADLITDSDQKPTTTRKTCDKGDSQDMDHALTSGQGKE